MKFSQKQKFFINSLVLLFVLLVPLTVNAETIQNCRNISYNWKSLNGQKKKANKYWIDSKFTLAERRFVKKALGIAVERIQDEDILQTVKSSYGFAHPKRKTFTDSGICNNLSGRRNILFHQISQLTKASDIFEKREFPKVNLHLRTVMPKRGKTGWVAYAYYNRVNIYWDYANRRWKRSGSFTIYLNRHYLRRAGIYKDVNYWAGTIAHEMLHNLGHQHPSASNKNYRKFQINVLANAIRSYGKGASAMASEIKYPKHQCNLKTKGTATSNRN